MRFKWSILLWLYGKRKPRKLPPLLQPTVSLLTYNLSAKIYDVLRRLTELWDYSINSTIQSLVKNKNLQLTNVEIMIPSDVTVLFTSLSQLLRNEEWNRQNIVTEFNRNYWFVQHIVDSVDRFTNRLKELFWVRSEVWVIHISTKKIYEGL